MEIRGARPDEAAALSELALRSKAHWGYSPEWLDRFRVDLTITAEEVAGETVRVAEVDGRPVGFYVVKGEPPDGVLDHLWIDPPAIGIGVGRRLVSHAADTARAAGFTALLIGSDPNAEGFYLAMGAERVGDTPSSSIPGRTIPLMRLSLSGM